MDRILIATPVKDAVRHLDTYFGALSRLTYPADHLSLGFLESDSADATYAALEARLPELQRRYRRARLWKRDFGFRIPAGIRDGPPPSRSPGAR